MLEGVTNLMAEPARKPAGSADPAEIAWAAGLFEGEGSFAMRRNGTVLATIAMQDRDVIERFRRIVGMGNLTHWAVGRWTPLWRLDIVKVADVLLLIEVLYPHLGERRRARADQAVAQLNARIEAKTYERACLNCNRRFRPPFNSQASRTKYCCRACMIRGRNRLARR